MVAGCCNRLDDSATEFGPRFGGNFPRDSEDAETVATIRRQIEMDDRIGKRQVLVQFHADRSIARQFDNAVGVVAEAQFGLGAQHAIGDDPTNRPLFQRYAVWQRQARNREHPLHALPDIGRAANDLDRLLAACRNLANAQAIRVGMLLHVDDLADDHAVESCAFDGYFVDFETEHGQLMRKVAGLQFRINPFTQPGLYDLHHRYLNCLRKRMSFSKNVRRSSTRYRSIASRSIPMPKA